MDSSFTYQGKLRQSGSAVNGAADFQFRLFDAATGGTQIGGLQAINNVNVADGLFTTTINFGAGAFNGDARWLEIAVRRPAGSGSYVTLTPRQPMTAAPYALKVPGVDGHSLNGADGSHTDALFVNNAGRVGIGTTSPVSLLDLNGVQDAFRIRGFQPYVTMVDTNAAGSPRAQLQNSDGRFFITSEAFIGGSNGGAFTMFDPQGRVGIGTFSPSSRVEIAAQDGLAITGYQPFITLRDTNANGARGLIATGNGDLAFYTNHSIGGSPPVVVKNATGAVGIGAAEPVGKLDVRTNGGQYGDIPAIRAENTALVGQALGLVASTTGRNGIAIQGLATDTTGVNYAVSGWSSSSNGYDFFAGGAGINYGSSSSRRWKHHIEPIADPLEKISRLRGVYFDWDEAHGGNHDVGMIAEEVGEVLPEVVAFEDNGIDAHGMDYSKLTPLLVEAIKTQQAQIERALRRIDSLEAANEELRAAVRRIDGRSSARPDSRGSAPTP